MKFFFFCFFLPKLTFQYITSIFFRYDDPEIVNGYHIRDEIKLNVGKVKCILHEVDCLEVIKRQMYEEKKKQLWYKKPQNEI